MNIYLLIAGILSIILGLVHSFLGELLIFNFSNKTTSADKNETHLSRQYFPIIRATWHLTTIFGCAIGCLLLNISFMRNEWNSDFSSVILPPIIYGMLAAAMIVLVGTRGRHPGWIVLFIIAILVIFGNN